jgi:hypothetical protein
MKLIIIEWPVPRNLVIINNYILLLVIYQLQAVDMQLAAVKNEGF